MGIVAGLRSEVHRRPNSLCSLVVQRFDAAGKPWGNQEDWLWEEYPTDMSRARACLNTLAGSAELNDPPLD